MHVSRFVAALLVSVCLGGLGLAQEPAPAANQAAQKLLRRARRARTVDQRRQLYRLLIRVFPAADPSVGEAQLDLDLLLSKERPQGGVSASDLQLQRLRLLADFWRGQPDSTRRAEALQRFRQLIGTPVPGPQPLLPGSTEVRLARNRPVAGLSCNTVYRVPGNTWQAPPDLRLQASPDSAWTRVSEPTSGWAGERRTVAIPCPPLTPGHYVVVQELVVGGSSLSFCEPFVVRSFHVYALEGAEGVVALALDPRRRPLAGLNLTLAGRAGQASATTDASGLARLRLKLGDDERGALTARRGDETWFTEVRQGFAEVTLRTFVSTDRPLYRPGQTVHYKAIRRRRGAGVFASPEAGSQVTVELRDPEDRVVVRQQQTWNELGSLSGSYTLGEEPPLGRYEVLLLEGQADEESDEEIYSAGSFEVAEYRKPDMQVSLTLEPTRDDRPDQATVVVNAERFFGGPLEGAPVDFFVELLEDGWSGDDFFVRRGGQRSRRLDPSPPFEDPLAWLYDDADDDPDDEDGWTSWLEPEEEVLEGAAETDAEGQLRLEFPARASGPQRYYRVTVAVEDPDGRVREVSEEFAIGRQEGRRALDVRVGSDSQIAAPGDPVRCRVRVRRPDGSPAAGATLSVRALWSEEPFAEALELEEAGRAPATTDASGYAEVTLPAPASGQLRFKVRAQLETGGRVLEGVGRADLYVTGRALTDSADRYDSLDLTPFRPAYRAGDTARLLLRRWQPEPAWALVTVEDNRVLSARVIRLEGASQVLEVALPEDAGPYAVVRVSVWGELPESEEELDRALDLGGTAAAVLHVGPRQPLELSLTCDKAEYRPGETAQFEITTAQGGAPVDAELELAFVDARVLDLVPDWSLEDLRPLLWGTLDDVFFAVDWLEAGARFPIDRSGDLPAQFGPRGGAFAGGGMLSFDDGGEDEAPPAAGPAPEVRQTFADTWHYAGQARTGSDGKLELSLQVPDGLTTWRLIARAITKDGQAQAEAEAVAKQPLSCRVVPPRFLVTGDQAVVASVLRNDTEAELTVKVRAQAEGLILARTEQTVAIKPHSEARLEWPVTAPKTARRVALTVTATSPLASDAERRELEVEPAGIAISTGDSGALQPDWRTAFSLPQDAEDATLDVYLVRSAADAVRQALPALIKYPYGCVEQTMSRFLPLIVAKRSLERLELPAPSSAKQLPDMVASGLARLYRFQHEDGGWGWWEHDETDERMTAYVMFGLLTAKEAGVQVDELVLERGLDALRSLDNMPFSFFVLELGKNPELPDEFFEEDFGDQLASYETQEEAAWLILTAPERCQKLIAELPQAPGKNKGYTSIRREAITLMALTKVNDPRAQRWQEWLIAQRQGSAWWSTLDSAWAVMALAPLIKPGQGPVQAKVLLDGAEPQWETVGPGHLRLEGLKPGAHRLQVTLTNEEPGPAPRAVRVVRYRSLEAPRPEEDAIVKLETRITRKQEDEWVPVPPGSPLTRGEELRLEAVITSETDRWSGEDTLYLLELPLPAGCEAIPEARQADPWFEWDFDSCRRELRDEQAVIGLRWLADGQNVHTVRIRPTHSGTYRQRPARLFDMYDPRLQVFAPARAVTIRRQ